MTAGGSSPLVALVRCSPPAGSLRRPFRGRELWALNPVRGLLCPCRKAAPTRCSGVIMGSEAQDRSWRPQQDPPSSGLGTLVPSSTYGPCCQLARHSPRRGTRHLQAWWEGEPCQAQWRGGVGPGVALMEISQTRMREGLGEWGKGWGGHVSGIVAVPALRLHPSGGRARPGGGVCESRGLDPSNQS